MARNTRENPTLQNAPSYAAAKNRYDKAHAVLADARERLDWTGVEDGELTYATFDAIQIIDAASRALGNDFLATKKHFGIGTYTPYGKQSWGRR